MTIRIETNSSDLEKEAQHLATKLREAGEEVEVWGSIKKTAGIEDVTVEVLKMYFGYAVGKHVFERVDVFLAEWFTERPRRDRPPLRVELYDQDEELVSTRMFGGAGNYQDEMSNQLWDLFEATEGRLEEKERHLIRAAADGIELLEAALKALRREKDR